MFVRTLCPPGPTTSFTSALFKSLPTKAPTSRNLLQTPALWHARMNTSTASKLAGWIDPPLALMRSARARVSLNQGRVGKYFGIFICAKIKRAAGFRGPPRARLADGQLAQPRRRSDDAVAV